MSAFPDGKHVVYVRSGRSDEGRDYCQIFIFDAIRYPDLSEPNHPDDLEENNPLASYLLPVPIHARSTEFEFATSGRQVTIKQPAMDDMPSMQYEIHLDNFSLPRHGTPVDAP